MNNPLLQKLDVIKQQIIKKKDEYQKKSNIISLIRGIDFLLILASIILEIIYGKLIIVIILLVLSFIVLIILHSILDNKFKYYQKYLYVIGNYEHRIIGDYHGRKEVTGMDFYDGENDFLQDLDVIGNNSLYQLINVARTHIGRRKLYESLSNPNLSNEKLKDTQEAIIELGNNLEFCLAFEASSYKIQDNAYFPSLKEINLSYAKAFISSGIILSITFIVIFILAFLGKANPYMLILPFLGQLLNYFIYNRLNKKSLDDIKDINDISSSIYDTLKTFSGIDFNSQLLSKYFNNIKEGKKVGKKISLISDFDTLRYNILSIALFNAIIPFSIVISYMCQKLLNKNLESIKSGIEAYYEFERLISLCMIKHIKSVVTMPTRNNKVNIKTVDLKHPLLEENKCVSNSFTSDSGINVITGSNMSGKTSFMRTIGINLILMNAGTFVNAKEFSACYLKIFTSMRVHDDITKGISTFYAELLRIKKALNYIESKQNMLTLIDEVFSGTNSNDRISGAVTLAKKLNRNNSIVIMTTHDFEICDLDITDLKNYHFSEYYENDKILFDYKIKEGKCTTTNAKYLMRLAGIKE